MNSRRSTEAEYAYCPQSDRLTGWLNGDCQLNASEINHIAGCPQCSQLLDELTDAPELSHASAESCSPSGFEAEPEFQALKDRMPELRGNSGEYQANKRSITTEVAGTAPLGARSDVPFHLRQLQILQQQIVGQRYRLQRILGSGGSGTVVLAYDNAQACDVAIKFLLREGPSERLRFEREAKMLGELEHPNIVRILEVGTKDHSSASSPTRLVQGPDSASHDGSLYLVMEYVSGGSAAELQKRLSSDWFSLARMLVDVAHGLHSAHQHGLVHRDVKPSNLLLDVKSNAWKVADFGLAKFETSESTLLTRSGDILGTPAFMSPEQVLVDPIAAAQEPQAKQPISGRSDIYSLGATMYALLTGQPPLQGSTAAILRQIPEVEPVRPRVLNPKIPAALEVICLHAMEKSALDRYPSMQALAEELERFIDGRPIRARPPSALARFRRWNNKNKLLASSLAGIAALLAMLAIGSTLTAGLIWRQQQRLLAQRQQNLQQLCSKIALATPAALPLAIGQLADDRDELLPFLQASWSNADGLRARLNLACALATLGAGREEYLIEQTGAAITSPGQCLAICEALSARPRASLELIRQKLSSDVGTEQRGKLAILALQLQDPDPFRAVVASDPDSRTALIQLMPSWHGDLSEPIRQLETIVDSQVVSALLVGIGLIDRLEFSSQDLDQLQRISIRVELERRDTGVQSAAYWMRRQLGLEVMPNRAVPSRAVPGDAVPGDAKDFSRSPESLAADTRLGFRMLRIPAGSFSMGSGDHLIRYGGRTQHPVTLSRSFWLADREVTVGLFQAFMDEIAKRSASQDGSRWQPDWIVSPSVAHPAQQVTWIQAAKFCNWLSARHGFDAYYEEVAPVHFSDAEGQDTVVENWVGRPSAMGYRLPTEAEFEYACRAGTQTLFSFGNDMRFFEDYVAWSNNTTISAAACGSLIPNPWGFFEMHGNVWEWCEDWYQDLESEAAVQDPLCTTPTPHGRCFRGGGICTFTGYPDSSSRGGSLPGRSFNNVGFRLARNAE